MQPYFFVSIGRCLQNAKVAILENDIHHCETSGIFMRLAAHGLVFGNDIYCTDEAGIDVRRNADPLIQVCQCVRVFLFVVRYIKSSLKLYSS